MNINSHGLNGFHSNQGASTSSGQLPSQYSMNQSHTQLNGNLPMRGPPIPQRHQPQQNPWNPHMTMNPQSISPVNGRQFSPQEQWMSPPSQIFQNAIPPGMNNAFNLPYDLPQNILQDAIALSTPVESADEPLLVQHILNGLRRGETYKEILNKLHGENGHSASLWKDYYLDHKPRLDSWVNMCLQKDKPRENVMGGHLQSIKKPAIKKPSPDSFKVEYSPGPLFATPASAPIKRKSSTPRESPALALTQATGSRRATINSLTAPAPVFDSRLPPPHADIKIPAPPSRSPTPPTRVIPQGRGNKYTPEDREFFIKFLQRQLAKNPNLNRNELCELIAEKAPHHTAQSWASHWSLNHDLPDKILAAARGKEYAQAEEDEATSEEEDRKRSRRKRPKYHDPRSSEDDAEGDEEEDEASALTVSDDDEDSDDGRPVKRWKESEMGEKGQPFTEADMYMAAKHIAEHPNWEGATSKERWAQFSEKYPQRSLKSWVEYLRRTDKDINRLVKKIKKEQSHASQSQRVRPARTPPRKRKPKRDGDA